MALLVYKVALFPPSKNKNAEIPGEKLNGRAVARPCHSFL